MNLESIFDLIIRFGQPIFLAFTIAVSALQLGLFYRRTLKDLTVSYRIAVLGLPRSGKTALIGAIFDRIFSSPEGRSFAPIGQETINRVNRVIANLDSRSSLPPTKENDVFIFRFLYYVRRTILFKGVRYEGEVVDFPGELSQQLLESSSDGTLRDDVSLFHREFFSWVISSKVHVFVIDSAQYLCVVNKAVFVAQISAEIRAAWQLLNEEITKTSRSPDRRVALVFSKGDILGLYGDTPSWSDEMRAEIKHFGFEFPPDPDIFDTKSSQKTFKGWLRMERDFLPLIEYFKSQDTVFKTFLVSAYSFDGIGRSGISGLVDFILPEHGKRKRLR